MGVDDDCDEVSGSGVDARRPSLDGIQLWQVGVALNPPVAARRRAVVIPALHTTQIPCPISLQGLEGHTWLHTVPSCTRTGDTLTLCLHYLHVNRKSSLLVIE